MSDVAPPYRQKYDDPRVDEAYRLFVQGKGSLQQLVEITGAAKRTLSRYSTRHKWVDEQSEYARLATHGTALATIEAFLAPADATDLEEKIAAALNSDDVKTRIGGVMTQQRIVYDELMGDVRVLYAGVKKQAAERGKPLNVGQLIVIIGMVDKIAVGQRKAHGIPDVTKLEFEDKSSTAELHARKVAERRQRRLSVAAAATAIKDMTTN